jgi:uncharacterized protein
MPNHLLDASSPYLLQHAHNPVDWYPWCAEALDRARREDQPIFLSIGYAACHWCHVMEHQCFENPEIAALMNAHFINIKVDREERPDLDDLFMLATQLMTGSGGWPMSVWLTPTLEPFYAGTYFPPGDAHGRPGFPRLLTALHDAWQNRRADLIAQAQKVVAAIRTHADETVSPQDSGLKTQDSSLTTLLRLAIEQFSDRFDDIHGGLGTAPKFPPHQALQLWLAMLADSDPARTGLAGAEQRVLAYKTKQTLDGMKSGGIYDHIGGGFARYSTDEQWLVPHFEKMLYDNAQFAPVYARASLLFDNPDYARIARETLDFFLREMCAGSGAFYSSLDADSEGREGQYYVWTAADIRAALPDPADSELILDHFGITVEGNWAESPVPGGNVPAIARSVESLAQKHEITPDAMRQKLSHLFESLRRARDRRPRPACDDKILTGWNGLMLSALAVTGRLLREEKYLRAAARLADVILAHHMTSAGLQRVSRQNAPAHTPGFLDDHAYLLNGLIDLIASQPANAAALQNVATGLAETLLRDFQDQAHGGFFFTGPRHEKLFARAKNAADNATPSANGVAVRALLRLARMTGQAAYRQAALRAADAFGAPMAARPEFYPTMLLALLEDVAATNVAVTLPGAVPAAAAVPENIAPSQIENQKSKIENLLTLTAAELPPLAPGASFDLTLHLTIAPGYHIPSADPTAGTTPTTVHLRSAPHILATQNWRFPSPQAIDGTLAYADQIDLHADCTVAPDAACGAHILRAILAAQLCTAAACRPPEQVILEVPLYIQSP